VAIGAGFGRDSLYNASQIPIRRGCNVNDPWNEEEAQQLLRAALAEIDALGDKLSPARAEALLDEFEQAVGRDFLRHNLSAVKLTCEEYERRFRALSEDG
jgi:hypothetical protein